MNKNIYMPISAKIENVVEETPTISTFFIQPEQPVPFKAGQFVSLTVPGLGEAPFTPSSSPAVEDRMEVTIMRVGRVTERLHSLPAGSKIGVRGPMGVPYPLDEFYGKNIVIIGGGVGLAPLRALFHALLLEADKFPKIYIRYGARTPNDIVYKKLILEEWPAMPNLDVLVTVDEGDGSWNGRVGVVTKIMDETSLPVSPSDSVAVVCGPPIMMKFGTLTLLERGYSPEQIYLSMEKNMSCGVGKCGHCVVGPYFACTDGPVFKYSLIKDVPEDHLWE